jgi:hypothetical protein
LNILRNDGIWAKAWDEDGFNPPTVWWSAYCLWEQVDVWILEE